jgi:hypothetical protein
MFVLIDLLKEFSLYIPRQRTALKDYIIIFSLKCHVAKQRSLRIAP